MTATPRIYTERSKRKLAEHGVDVVDMGDYNVYGPELHRLPFAKAVDHKMLSDYRVIVLADAGTNGTLAAAWSGSKVKVARSSWRMQLEPDGALSSIQKCVGCGLPQISAREPSRIS